MVGQGSFRFPAERQAVVHQGGQLLFAHVHVRRVGSARHAEPDAQIDGRCVVAAFENVVHEIAGIRGSSAMIEDGCRVVTHARIAVAGMASLLDVKCPAGNSS